MNECVASSKGHEYRVVSLSMWECRFCGKTATYNPLTKEWK
jgi:hypothetical protein